MYQILLQLVLAFAGPRFWHSPPTNVQIQVVVPPVIEAIWNPDGEPFRDIDGNLTGGFETPYLLIQSNVQTVVIKQKRNGKIACTVVAI